MNRLTASASVFTSFVAAALAAAPLAAQTASIIDTTSPRGSTTSPFAPLTLGPAPSATRLANGAPGPKYWQNRADYDLKVTLDTAAQTLRGSMVLRYTNNSPNPLPILWFQTERRGEVLDRFDQVVGGKPVAVTHDHPTGDVYETQVTLAEPVKPGQTTTFHVEWHYGIQKRGLYQLTQWYPRLNVYDDVKGWNTESYATGAEYFLEYGDYTLEVTLPAGYIVAATGTLDNPKDVLTAAGVARLAQASQVDTIVRIITAAELQSGTARPSTKDGMLTWKFHSKNTRDAVWGASLNYQWDATHWHGILAQAYYQPSAVATWADAADQARMSIQEYSERWYPYPYPQISVVEGPGGGMEYPMLSMVSQFNDQAQQYDVITHEVGHNWFPMVVGSNERMHTWMDEGFNQFINTFSNARRYPQGGDQTARAQFYVRWIGQTMTGKNGEKDEVLENGNVIGNAGGQYFKTAGVLEMLRRDVMGPEAFDKGLRMYIQRWAYKHPTPMDFFRTMNDAAGKNLDWFWQEWFLEIPKFDQALDSVQVTPSGTGTHVRVVYANRAAGVMPLRVRFTFADSTTQDVTYPVDIWKKGPTYTASYDFPGKTVTKIWIDEDQHFVDIDRTNNRWMAK